MKRYVVTFERDEEDWWVASVRGVQGVHTQGRSIEEARRRVREALALAIGDKAAKKAKLIDDIKLPANVQRVLASLRQAQKREERVAADARRAALKATRVLTQQMRLSRRDAAVLTGFSFQRIHQLAHKVA